MCCSCVLWLFVLIGFGFDEEMLFDGLIKKKIVIKKYRKVLIKIIRVRIKDIYLYLEV